MNGNDDDHLCKPTSVEVSANAREFYLADGYCNHRFTVEKTTIYYYFICKKIGFQSDEVLAGD